MNVHNFMNFDNFWSLLAHFMVLPACFKKGGFKDSEIYKIFKRRVKKKERRSKRGKGGKRKENKSTNLLMKKEKNMRGKEMKKMDKGTNEKKTEKLWNQSDTT